MLDLPLDNSIEVIFSMGTNFVLSRIPSQKPLSLLCALQHINEQVTDSHLGHLYLALVL